MVEPVLTRSTVLHATETQGLVLVVLQLVAGEIVLGMVLGDDRHRWRVTGISTVPAEEWFSGRRGVALQALDSQRVPRTGAELREAVP